MHFCMNSFVSHLQMIRILLSLRILRGLFIIVFLFMLKHSQKHWFSNHVSSYSTQPQGRNGEPFYMRVPKSHKQYHYCSFSNFYVKKYCSICGLYMKHWLIESIAFIYLISKKKKKLFFYKLESAINLLKFRLQNTYSCVSGTLGNKNKSY